MQIENIKIFRRKGGVCVEFVGRNGEAIEVELHGDDLGALTDEELVSKAKAAMNEVGHPEPEEPRDEAGVDQTLTQP